MSRRTLFTTLAVLAAAGPVSAGAPGDWQAPFSLDLPAPPRQVSLAAGLDPARWAGEAGLDGFRLLYRGPGGSILQAPMTDTDWQAFQAERCAAPGVRCETAACRGIQFRGSVDPGAHGGPDGVTARLVRSEPELDPLDGDGEGDAAMCRRPVALAGPDRAAGSSLDLTLDIDGRSGSRASSATAVDAADAAPGAEPPAVDASAAGPDGAPSPETSAAPAAARSFAFTLERGFDALGGASLAGERLPDDTSDWSLMVNAGCTAVEVPMDALEPARVPGHVTALVDAGTAAAVALAFGVTVVREIELDATDQALTVFAGAGDVAAAAAALLLDPRVSAAQPEYVYRTTADFGAARPDAGGQTDDGPAPAAPAYSDPFAALSYGPRLTGAAALHSRARGTGQLVAVIDTGVDAEHPDLAGRVRETLDVTGDGWSADLHGTAVAGIIAATADNAEGSYGVAPDVALLAIKACQPVGPGALRAKCRTSSLVKALDLAMSRDAAVINLSLAGPPDDLVARYVALAAGQDRLVVAGSGNNGPNARPAYPAALPEVVAVTAVDAAERRYADANLGEYIDVAAPGVDIISPAPGGSYPPLSGTSMASAHVAGAAALLRELSPLLGGRELAAVIRGAGRDLGAPGRDAEFGIGLMDACAAAARATADAVTCEAPGGSHGP